MHFHSFQLVVRPFRHLNIMLHFPLYLDRVDCIASVFLNIYFPLFIILLADLPLRLGSFEEHL
jgi:hypothetical protein